MNSNRSDLFIDSITEGKQRKPDELCFHRDMKHGFLETDSSDENLTGGQQPLTSLWTQSGQNKLKLHGLIRQTFPKG